MSLKYALFPPTMEIIDVTHLPAEKKLKGYLVVGLFVMVFGIIFIIPGVIHLIDSISSGIPYPEQFMGSLFLMGFGLPFFLFGLDQLVARGSIRITPETVHYEYSSLFKRKKWNEMVSNYEGILARDEVHYGNDKVGQYTLYILELYHRDKAKTVQLYSSPSKDNFEELQKSFCSVLHVPDVYTSGDKIVKRNSEDVGKSVQEMVSEDKIKIEDLDWRNPPEGLAVELANDVITVNILEPRPIRVVEIMMLLLPFLPIFTGVLKASEATIALIGIGGLSELVLLWVFLSPLITTPQLRISFEGVKLSKLTSFGKIGEVYLRRAEIQKVYIKEIPDFKYIVIEGKVQKIVLGMGLSDKSLQWLEQFILKALS